MYRLFQAFVLAICACVSVYSGAVSAEPGQGAIRGAITDSSGGALPGVTVIATSTEGRVVASAVSDGAGVYELSALPAAEMRLTFQLDGFVIAAESVVVEPGTVALVKKRLELAPVTETVVVVGQSTDVTRTAVQPPAPVVTPIPEHDRASICGPAKASPTPESFGTIQARRLEAGRELYTKDDEVVIDGGTLTGLEVGQNVVVRRHFRVTDVAGAVVTGEHTAGVLQIVTAGERVSSAVVVYACDELMKGDFLAPFRPEPLRAPDPGGLPAYGDAARILFADAGQTLGAPGRLMVIDRGSEHGLHVGQRLTLFRRRRHEPAKPSVVGDAVVVAIRADSATIRVDGVRDAISSGDWAAPHLPLTLSTAAGGAKPD
jgi:hypothetical protein